MTDDSSKFIEVNPNVRKYFDEHQDIFDRSENLIARVYVKFAKKAVGNVYGGHGYLGAPTEMSMKMVADAAVANNQNAVMLEACGASITDLRPKTIKTLSLNQQKLAMSRALAWCRDFEKLAGMPNLFWGHSRANRWASDAAVRSRNTKTTVSVAKFFDEFVLANPYLISPQKLRDALERVSQNAAMTKRLLDGKSKKVRNIDGIDYECCSYLINLIQAIPPEWNVKWNDLEGIAKITYSHIQPIHSKPVTVLLGDQDHEAEYKENLALLSYAPFNLKRIDTIPGAGHYFEERPNEYHEYADSFMHARRKRIAGAQKLIVPMSK